MKSTFQYLSQRFPMPKILFLNPDIKSSNSPGGRSGRGNLQDTSDPCAWPVAVPTHIVPVVLFTLDTGVSGVKYHPLAPKSTISVYCLASLVAICMANLCSHFREMFLFLCWDVDSRLPNGSKGIIKLAGDLKDSEMVGLQVGCGLINKELLSLLITLRPSLSIPRRHFKQDFHQCRRLYLFFSNLEQ